MVVMKEASLSGLRGPHPKGREGRGGLGGAPHFLRSADRLLAPTGAQPSPKQLDYTPHSSQAARCPVRNRGTPRRSPTSLRISIDLMSESSGFSSGRGLPATLARQLPRRIAGGLRSCRLRERLGLGLGLSLAGLRLERPLPGLRARNAGAASPTVGLQFRGRGWAPSLPGWYNGAPSAPGSRVLVHCWGQTLEGGRENAQGGRRASFRLRE